MTAWTVRILGYSWSLLFSDIDRCPSNSRKVSLYQSPGMQHAVIPNPIRSLISAKAIFTICNQGHCSSIQSRPRRSLRSIPTQHSNSLPLVTRESSLGVISRFLFPSLSISSLGTSETTQLSIKYLAMSLIIFPASSSHAAHLLKGFGRWNLGSGFS